MEDRLVIRYIPLDEAVLWDKNPKLHDIGALVESFDRYGFRDAPIFDETKGCIVAGHGRIKALTQMRNMGYPLPRGIYQSDDDWMVPVQFGVNARTQGEAEAFAIDHNNIGLMGGDLTLFDMAKIWDKDYVNVLVEIVSNGGEIVSVDKNDLDALLSSGIEYGDLREASQKEDGTAHVWARFSVEVHNEVVFEDVINAVREVLDSNPEWDAKVKE